MMFTFWGPYNLIIRITFIRVLNVVPYCWGNYQVGGELRFYLETWEPSSVVLVYVRKKQKEYESSPSVNSTYE